MITNDQLGGWDVASMVALLYVALLAPLQVGFVIEADPAYASFWIDRAVDLFFVFDVVLSLIRPYSGGWVGG